MVTNIYHFTVKVMSGPTCISSWLIHTYVLCKSSVVFFLEDFLKWFCHPLATSLYCCVCFCKICGPRICDSAGYITRNHNGDTQVLSHGLNHNVNRYVLLHILNIFFMFRSSQIKLTWPWQINNCSGTSHIKTVMSRRRFVKSAFVTCHMTYCDGV